MKKIIIIAIILLLILGHTPYYDLNELAVVDTIGISQKENKYYLYLNIVNENNKIYKIKGDSLGEIFLKANTINNKKTYFKHLNIIIFDTSILNNNKLLYFLKDEFTTIDYLTVATEDLNSIFPKFHKSADYKNFITKENNMKGTIINTTFKDLLGNSLNELKSASLPLLSQNNNNLVNKGLYIINKDYILNKKLTKIYYLLNNEITFYNQKIKLNNNYNEVYLYNLKSSIKYKDKNLTIKITGNIDSPDTNNLTEIKNKVINNLKKDIKSLITLETTNDLKISNIINTIYQKDKNINNYKDANKKIIIDLKIERRNNYD